MEYKWNAFGYQVTNAQSVVLILVLMEYKWNYYKDWLVLPYGGVLILVLMEYKWNSALPKEQKVWFVLILVLMEYKWNDMVSTKSNNHEKS